ncbi:hypothetical protein E7Z59_03705 [Robertkochia marina]|uniref:Uncharacterized protein n=1 Tax=Robertkochia marina TaxID=1227945 RepID=A0A4S3M2T2_9FLAO|nr:DUF6503 family protein [Robertkochia marina]THD69444.1 hypothetical protein E7Z59_03705 [Robertkochia marina]TRZ47295.1 hypothetical protein D3A96_00870 [Robertkochia marina]
MKHLLPILLFVITFTSCNPIPDGEALLNKSIAYHDPEGNWPQFKGALTIELTTPDQPVRNSELTLNLPENRFTAKTTRDTIVTYREFSHDSCTFELNGRTDLSAEEIEAHRGTCERTEMMKNYYTYLYGLPMKLRDPGTHIDPQVTRKTFQGQEYLVLKATYDPEVGKDTWYFYMNPETYAMEVYQFFHDENEVDGEYIILKDLMEVQGMRIPKSRSWYTNKEDKFLGTDLLVNAK